MQKIHSFKELRRAVSEKVASFTPYTEEEKEQRSLQLQPPIAVYENKDDEPTFIAKTIIRKYRDTVKWNKMRVNASLRPIYGRDLIFPDNMTTEMVIKVKNVMEATGKTIKEVGKDLRAYLGYPCSFFRKEGNRQVPVNSDRLLKAYKAMEAKKLVYEIERILFE